MTCTQASVLCNHKNNARLIATLTTSLTLVGITCKQSQADVNFFICSTAVELAKGFGCQVFVMGKYTDLLVILIDRLCPELYI